MVAPQVDWLTVALDLVVVVAWHVAVGFTAPRWPKRWLDHDRWPVRPFAHETATFYRRIGVRWLTRVLPEAGAAMGGSSKAVLPGFTEPVLRDYLVEVRRAEWVHVLCMPAFLLLIPLSPWPYVLVFAAGTIGGNLVFLLVLRHNHLRLANIVKRFGNGT